MSMSTTKSKSKGKGTRASVADELATLARIRARNAAASAARWHGAEVALHNIMLDKVHAAALAKIERHYGCATRAEAVRRAIEIAAESLK